MSDDKAGPTSFQLPALGVARKSNDVQHLLSKMCNLYVAYQTGKRKALCMLRGSHMAQWRTSFRLFQLPNSQRDKLSYSILTGANVLRCIFWFQVLLVVASRCQLLSFLQCLYHLPSLHPISICVSFCVIASGRT